MALEGYQPVVVRVFGGLCDLVDRVALPLGLSPLAENVEFGPNSVRSRDGYQLYLTDTSGVTSLLSYVKPNLERRLIIMERNGRLKQEYPKGTLTTLDSLLGLDIRINGCILYGRAWIAFESGREAATYAAWFNGTNLRRISMEPPGAAGAAMNTGAGGVSAGYHCLFHVYENEYGSWSGASPITVFNAGGGQLLRYGFNGAAVTDRGVGELNIGPSNAGIVKRRVFVTPVNNYSDFYHLENGTGFTVDNNVNTRTDLNWLDSTLIKSGVPGDAYLAAEPLPLVAGVISYHDRLIAYGAQPRRFRSVYVNVLTTPATSVTLGFTNLSFDAGRAGTLGVPEENAPYGWSWVPGPGPAGGSTIVSAGALGYVWRGQADGASVTRGTLRQQGQNYVAGYPAFTEKGHRYGIRARARADANLTVGDIEISLSYSGGPGIAALSITPTQFLSGWQVFTSDAGTIVADPTYATVDLTVVLDGNGVPTAPAGAGAEVDWIEIFDYDDTSANSTVWCSGDTDPDFYSPATGLISVSEGDGQLLRSAFVLRDALYLAKDKSLYVTTDNLDEPGTWRLDLADEYSGTVSPHSVGKGPGFVVIAAKSACYVFDGGKPTNISQEIETTWRSIDWDRADEIFVILEPDVQRVRMGVPLVGVTDLRLLVLDYREGWGSPFPSGEGRKWSVDISPGTTCGTIVEAYDGALAPYYGRKFTDGQERGVPYIGDWSASATRVSLGFAPAYGGLVSPDPFGATTAVEVTAIAGGPPNTVTEQFNIPLVAPSVVAGRYLLYTLWIRAGGGNTVASTAITVSPYNGNPTLPGAVLTSTPATTVAPLTTTWVRQSVLVGPLTAATNYLRIEMVTSRVTAMAYQVYGAQLQESTGGGDHGYVVGTSPIYTNVTGAETGCITTRVMGLRNDHDGPIDARYETAPFGPEVGRGSFERSVFRMRGDGMLYTTYVLPNNTPTYQHTASLAATPEHDVEIGANQQGTSMGIRFGNVPHPTSPVTPTQRSSYWVLRRMATYIKEHTFGLLRGHNS